MREDILHEELTLEQKAQQQEMTRIRLEELDDLRIVMGSQGGRRLIHRMLSRAGIYKCSFAAEGSSELTAFNEGGRNLGLWVLSEVGTACPAHYLKMIEEHKNE